jgi:hypothetical protein
MLCKLERTHVQRSGEGVRKGLNVVRKHMKKQRLLSILQAVRSIDALSKVSDIGCRYRCITRGSHDCSPLCSTLLSAAVKHARGGSGRL